VTVEERRTRTHEADQLCSEVFTQAGCPERGVSLVAVGGYGRRELAPHSDLDLVLLVDQGLDVGDWATEVWYPLWDSGWSIDHSVRDPEQVLSNAQSDLRVAMGLLDLRHLAGDPNLTLRIRSAVLTQWRRDARTRLTELRELVDRRAERYGELGHAAVPDLKESVGGLRDATVLRALVASWLVDIPHTALDRCISDLQDVRDSLHRVAGRATDRVIPELWDAIAVDLGMDTAMEAQAFTRSRGRRLAHLSRLIWRRAEAVQRRSPGPRGPRLQPLGEGIAISAEEIVLDKSARPESDSTLLLKAACAASEKGLVLAPTTAARLARAGTRIPEPWSPRVRDLFVRMLAGPGLLTVWETLEETGSLALILPEWERVRLLPHASVVHRFTVDRHLVEACHEAAGLIRGVARPDVLLVAALLHDIGKGEQGDHSVLGAPMAAQIAQRMGFGSREVQLIRELVRWHLLLPEVATTRDLDDPTTVSQVVDRLRDPELLELLIALTQADARATSAKAWTPWRASLVNGLVERVAEELVTPDRSETAVGEPASVPAENDWGTDPGPLDDPYEIRIVEHEDGSRVLVRAMDRSGLLADVSAMFVRQRIQIRAARIWTTAGVAHSAWEVAENGLDVGLLRQRLKAIASGSLDTVPHQSGLASAADIAARVLVHPNASERASVVEVRSSDRVGLVNLVSTALTTAGVSIRSAHLSTFGPQAVDVFYLVDSSGEKLDPEHLEQVAGLLVKALNFPAPG
jgi:[protein-PII] uridylyltransferase